MKRAADVKKKKKSFFISAAKGNHWRNNKILQAKFPNGNPGSKEMTKSPEITFNPYEKKNFKLNM